MDIFFYTRTRTHLDVTSPPRVDPNFVTHFTGKGGLSIFKWSALSMRSADNQNEAWGT